MQPLLMLCIINETGVVQILTPPDYYPSIGRFRFRCVEEGLRLAVGLGLGNQVAISMRGNNLTGCRKWAQHLYYFFSHSLASYKCKGCHIASLLPIVVKITSEKY